MPRMSGRGRGLAVTSVGAMVPNMKFSKHKVNQYTAVWYTFIPGIFYRADKVPFEIKLGRTCGCEVERKTGRSGMVYSSARFMVIMSVLNGGNEMNMDPVSRSW